jgi:hypothetical protein
MDIQGTKSQKLISYIERVADYLGLYELDAYIEIEIKKYCDGGAGGFCNGDDNDVLIEIARNDAVGRIPMDQMMINIAHEMVHAQQMASGRLINKGLVFRKEKDGSQTLTTKQIFDGVEYVGVPYMEQPWEIEAYGLEEKVYESCK